METLGLIIKPSRKCNLRCGYCQDWRQQSDRMSFEILATLTARALLPRNHRRVDFIWHGGEPLLLGVDYYQKAIALQAQFSRPGLAIKNSMQTNGTLLTERWCDFFAENNIHVGVSIDGPQLIHDNNRRYTTGKSSFDDVRNGIALLKKYQIPFGVLMVLNEHGVALGARQLYNFFVKELEVKRFSLLAARPDNSQTGVFAIQSQHTQTSTYVDFMKELFDVWLEADDPEVKIRELNSILGSILGALPTACTLAGNCIGQYYLVEPNGDLHHCDKYLGDSDYYLGNVQQSSFEDIKLSQKMIDLCKAENAQIEDLHHCEFFGICNGGCPHDRYVAKRFSKLSNVSCCGQRELIAHVSERVQVECATFHG